MYLLDTNTLIYFFTQRGQVAQRMRTIPAHLIKLAAPSLFELEYGTAKSARPGLQRQQINDVLGVYESLPLDYAAAKAAGQLRHSLESVGKPIGTVDQLIAGIALANKLTVVTHNTSEFGRVPGLQVEDWYA
jgi:tRNA(fMet)-specific endonuclease VapC